MVTISEPQTGAVALCGEKRYKLARFLLGMPSPVSLMRAFESLRVALTLKFHP